MAFITPIYNRTSTDVAYVFAHQGSDSELKGALNVSDLNRIENNVEWLHEQLYAYGYSNLVDVKTDWVNTDFIYLDDIDRIRQNVLNLVNAYYDLAESPTIVLGQEPLSYTHINDIEKVIFDIDSILNRMIEYFRISGTFVAGQGVILP